MNHTKNLFVFLISLAVASTSFAKPTNAELKIGISQEFDSLNPMVSTMVAATYIKYMVNRRLTNQDGNGKWIPQIVKDIPTVENGMAKIITDKGQKKLVTQWEIRESAKWGDGTPVTCDDIILKCYGDGGDKL